MPKPSSAILVAFLLGLGGHAQAASAGYRIYVTNEAAGSLTVIDGATDKVMATTALGKRPRGLCASPDGRLLYIALSGSPIAGPGVSEATLPPADKSADGIGVFDVATGQVARVLKGVSDPEQVAVSPDGSRLYVASEDGAALVTLDTQSGAVVGKLPAGDEPEGVAVAPGGRVLVTSEGDGVVSLVDATAQSLIARIPVGLRPRGLVVTQDGTAAFVSEEAGGSVAKLDLVKHAVAGRLQSPDASDRPMGLALSPDGKTLFVTTGRGGHVEAVDTTDLHLIASATIGPRPWGVAVSPDGTRVYTADGPANTVHVLDAKSLKPIGIVASPGKPWGVTVLP